MKAYIFTINTSGYGSPQFLYLSKVLEKNGIETIIYEPYEKDRKFFKIEGYDRKLLKNKWLNRLLKLLIIIKSYFRPLIIITGQSDWLFGLLSKKTIIVYYYLEMIENIPANNFKVYFINKFFSKVNFILAPQEDRLLHIQNLIKKRGYIIQNAPLLSSNLKKITFFEKKKCIIPRTNQRFVTGR